MSEPCRIAVLISGNGSNLQAIIDAIQQQQIHGRIVAVISNKADAYGLQRAEQAGIETVVIDHRDYHDRERYDEALIECIDSHRSELVVLAGFMRILSDAFVDRYRGRLLNIHPSLLPKYKGLNTHQRVLEAGEKVHGATVHFVTPQLDDGPVIVQATVPVLANDTIETLAQRVHIAEHQIYPLAVQWFADKRLSLNNATVCLDGQPMTEQQRQYIPVS